MTERGVRACISVAGNIAPTEVLPKALEQLRRATRLAGLSRFFVTPAIGRPEQPDYYNGVATVETNLPPRALKFDLLRGIEEALGRVRGADKFAARTVDLDVLLYGDWVVREHDLVIPDPDLLDREFLAAGVLELAPDIVVPSMTAPLRDLVDAGALARLRVDEVFSRQMHERFAL